jgi:hypothetical protein
MKEYRVKQLWIISWCLWVLFACQPTNISKSTLIAEPITPTQIIISPTSKIVEMSTPMPTFSPEVVATNTSTPIPTQTPLPPLSPEEALATVTTLYETNRDCLLPCWWGFTPGQTNWITAREFLSPIADAIFEPSEPAENPTWNVVEIHLPNTFYNTSSSTNTVCRMS